MFLYPIFTCHSPAFLPGSRALSQSFYRDKGHPQAYLLLFLGLPHLGSRQAGYEWSLLALRRVGWLEKAWAR